MINPSNFNRSLRWLGAFRTDNLGARPEYKPEGTPLEVGNGFTTAGTRRDIIALNAKTGELKWVYGMGGRSARRARAPPEMVWPRRNHWTGRHR